MDSEQLSRNPPPHQKLEATEEFLKKTRVCFILRIMRLNALCLIFLWSSYAHSSGGIGAPQTAKDLGALGGWSGFSIQGLPGFVWLVKTVSRDRTKFIDSIVKSRELLKKLMTPTAEITEDWFELQEEFEEAADEACRKLSKKKLMAFRSVDLVEGSVFSPSEESAVIQVSAQGKGLAIESAAVRCVDPKGKRLPYLLMRSTVLLTYVAAAELTDRAKAFGKRPQGNTRDLALIPVAALRQTVSVFQNRRPWFQKNAPRLIHVLERAQQKMQQRLKRYESKYREEFSSDEDLRVLESKKGLEAKDWLLLELR